MASEYLTVVQDLREREAWLAGELSQVRQAVAALERIFGLNGSGEAGPSKPSKTSARPVRLAARDGQLSTRDAVLEALRESGAPMRPKEIADRLTDMDAWVYYTNPVQVGSKVSSALHVLSVDNEIHRTDDGWCVGPRLEENAGV